LTAQPLGYTISASYLYNGTVYPKTSMRAVPSIDSGAAFSMTSGSAGTVAVNNTLTNSLTTESVSIYNSAGNWTVSAQGTVTMGLNAEL
jgi:hypothetical protein